jgi:hypothetical protein
MAWKVRGRHPDGSVSSILCDNPEHVRDILIELRSKAYAEVWVRKQRRQTALPCLGTRRDEAMRVRTTRCSGFAHVRNSVRAAPLLSTASLMNPLCACANGAKRHLASEHRIRRVRSFAARISPWPEQPLPPHPHATGRRVAVLTEFPERRHTPARQPTCSPVGCPAVEASNGLARGRGLSGG